VIDDAHGVSAQAAAHEPYLLAAQRLANASVSSAAFRDISGVIREACNCGSGGTSCCEEYRDGVEFRGPFVRGLSELYAVRSDLQVKALLEASLHSALQHHCSDTWQFGPHWSGSTTGSPTAPTQVPALDLLAATYRVVRLSYPPPPPPSSPPSPPPPQVYLWASSSSPNRRIST
jgi:hypothetical protein